MIISSLQGVFSIVVCEKDQDRLIVRAKSKQILSRIFDEKRILECNNEGYTFCVYLCKQEFAHTVIQMIKEVNYSNYNQYLKDMNVSSDQIFA